MLLFMVPSDTDDIKKEYNVLINELQLYNPELLDKKRMLAITKSDLLDDELIEALSEDLPEIPHIFISSHTNHNVLQLKDMIWKIMNS